MSKEITQFKDVQDFKLFLAKNYQKQVENLFGDKDKALEFFTNVGTSVQRNPKLLDCAPESIINSFMTMASLKLMPSAISGEAYVLPYNVKGQMVAQFQLGYQGLVTLFYRAGAKSIVAEIVHAKDSFSFLNGEINHVFDPFAEERGDAIGAYVIVELQTGGKIYKTMSKKAILEIAKKFSKSYGGSFGPWSEGQDPEGWMWKKTVLKQAAKLVPKNETIYKALDADNEDSVIPSASDAPKEPLRVETDYSDYEDMLLSIQTLERLEKYYADLPAAAKLALKGMYDGQKAILSTEAKGDIQ